MESPDTLLCLTPIGTFHAHIHTQRTPDAERAALQLLMPNGPLLSTKEWLAHPDVDEELLAKARQNHWIETVSYTVLPPEAQMDYYLPYAIAGLSAQRMAVLASEDGFCLARAGYPVAESDALAAMAADLSDFMQRQRHRGWYGAGNSIAFHDDMNMLLPSTSLYLLWVDSVGYWLILGGEPLLNNRALVDVVWRLHVAKFNVDQ